MPVADRWEHFAAGLLAIEVLRQDYLHSIPILVELLTVTRNSRVLRWCREVGLMSGSWMRSYGLDGFGVTLV